MDRRSVLRSLVALAGWLALGRGSATAEQSAHAATPLSAADRIPRWQERVRSILKRGLLPIIDTEATYGRDIPTDYMVEQMDKNGVALVCFAPNFNDPKRGSRFSLDLANEHPDRFVPTTCDGTTDYWFRQEGPFLEVIQREARSGDFLLMGELEFRHFPSPRQYRDRKFWRDISIPIDGPWGHAFFQLSVETKLAFQIHYEPEDELLAPLEKMLKAYPGAKVIWCHAGQVRYPAKQSAYGPDYLNRTLSQHPNLFCDLALAAPGTPYPGSGFVHNTAQLSDGRLRPEWQKLLEAHPERFTIGSDIAPDRPDDFPRKIAQSRKLLASLPAETAARIAFQNAWRLLTGQGWTA
ncbi:MAG: hypothetical protein A3G35_02870 [candidate division NC10 bacterium RIFCSPLOWO2_12_FULL_66_18]|nr:MAG: hypothetical protein A3G35_02870 [candidate division NC10 bacterium RIFCSPLOWO2_12_FULL_66_18]